MRESRQQSHSQIQLVSHSQMQICHRFEDCAGIAMQLARKAQNYLGVHGTNLQLHRNRFPTICVLVAGVGGILVEYLRNGQHVRQTTGRKIHCFDHEQLTATFNPSFAARAFGALLLTRLDTRSQAFTSSSFFSFLSWLNSFCFNSTHAAKVSIIHENRQGVARGEFVLDTYNRSSLLHVRLGSNWQNAILSLFGLCIEQAR